tara:strand:+ start:12713 stop:12973 length:261 start_codon:yes stop_codon:yes gene_type:complete
MSDEKNHNATPIVTLFLQSVADEAKRSNVCMECVVKELLITMVTTTYLNIDRDFGQLADILAAAMSIAINEDTKTTEIIAGKVTEH